MANSNSDPEQAGDAAASLRADEERKRAEIRRKAEADLAAFNEQRQKEVEERRRQRAAAAEASPPQSAGYAAAPMPGPLPAGALQALLGSGGAGGSMEEMLKTALANPGLAGALQQAMQSSSPAAAAAGPPGPSPIAVRVREAGVENSAFRRVLLRAADGASAGPPTFAQVESLVAAKFASSRRPDGSEVGLRRLVTLIRLSDNLQVADDEDVAELSEGDELEATFAKLAGSSP
eukprot:TRINITY_DN95230_c0_g1_i1.p1 TRINITY_DN95230_c0_g1~~TRINITY_DN95230_c0_g1_i1.p1  ORF type:complete len:234 (-),score=68.60 TRINITY_DN95230_c0_g1_i1:85-786(-)